MIAGPLALGGHRHMSLRLLDLWDDRNEGRGEEPGGGRSQEGGRIEKEGREGEREGQRREGGREEGYP